MLRSFAAVLATLAVSLASPTSREVQAAGPTIYVVTNTSGDVNVAGSLPWAVHQANYTTPGFDRIHFNISGSGQKVINITSTLYVIDQVDINAKTQPGYAGTPLVWVLGSASVPSIFYLGHNPWGNGTSSVSTIHGFGLYKYTANAVTITHTSQGNWIQDNWMGFMPSGSSVLTVRNSGLPGVQYSRGVGISSSHNVIRRNTISGVDNAVTIGLPTLEGAPYYGNSISENKIGTNPAGTSTVGYGNSSDGIFVGWGATANWIGPSNVLSGNASAGIEFLDAGNAGSVVFRNYIGLDVTGRVALGNGELGVLVSGWARNNSIGGPWGANYIAGNRLGGVAIGTSSWGGGIGNWVTGNVIGLNVDGVAVGVQSVGITVGSGSQYNSISNNTIGGHTTHGVLVGDQTKKNTLGNSVSGNDIGRTATGTVRTNAAYGVFLWNTNNNWITSNRFGANTLGSVGQQSSSGNVIS